MIEQDENSLYPNDRSKKTISSFANEGIGKKHRFCDRNGADKLDGFRSMR